MAHGSDRLSGTWRTRGSVESKRNAQMRGSDENLGSVTIGHSLRNTCRPRDRPTPAARLHAALATLICAQRTPLQTCAHELVRSGCDANRPNLGDLRQRQTASFFCISQKKSRLTTQHLRHYDTMAVRRLSPTPSFWATHSSHIRSLYRSDARGACGCLRASIEAKDRPDRRRITHVRIGSSRIFQDLHH